MDSGRLTKQGVMLNTNAFKYNEIVILTSILNRIFKLETIIQKLSNEEDKYSINIKSNSIPLLIKIVQPYIHPTMLYKIGI